MSDTETYTLAKEPIDPEKWEPYGEYYYKNVEKGQVVLKETFYNRLYERAILVTYLEEFEA